MDGERPTETEAAQLAADLAPRAAKGRRKAVPAWSDAIPDDLNFSDPLELAAKLGPAAVAIALVQVLSAVGIKPLQRAAMVAQLAGQLPGLIDKRRLWEAEKAIRGEAEELQETSSGPKAVENPIHAATTEAATATGRAKAIRGRPRKRTLL